MHDHRLVEADAALGEGDLMRAHVLRSEAVYFGAKAQKGWALEAEALERDQPAATLDELQRQRLRVASQARRGAWAYRTVEQYREKPSGPVLAVTNDHASRAFSDSFPPTGDAEVELFARLPALMGVELKHASLTDAGVADLSRVKHLRHLSLEGCSSVTGKTISSLRGLTCLTFELNPRAGAPEFLASLMKLEALALERAPSRCDDILRLVAPLSTLRSLRLAGGFALGEAELRQLTSGSMLVGVESARRLPRLQTLDVSGASQLDEAALTMLGSLPALETLLLGRHQASAATRAKLAAALPKLKIVN